MDAQKVDMFIMANLDYFEAHQLLMIKERLLSLPDNRLSTLQMIQPKSPTTALLLSIFLGAFGVDRFYIGDTGMGVGKLLTCGGCGIWKIIDCFLIMGDTRRKNLENLLRFL